MCYYLITRYTSVVSTPTTDANCGSLPRFCLATFLKIETDIYA